MATAIAAGSRRVRGAVTAARLALGLVVAGALAGGVALAPADAGAAEVSVRIEGSATTLFEGPVAVAAGPVDGGDGSGPHACGSGAPSLAAALDAATRRAGIAWRGAWNPDLQDFFVERIGPDASTHATASYWAALVDWRYAGGACATAVEAGAEVLWAYDSANRPLLLRLTGPTHAAVGETVAVTVRDGWIRADSGRDGGPVVGATIGGAPGATTDGAGTARITFATPGLWRLKAERSDAVRSNALDVCVGDGRCEGALPAPKAPPAGPPPTGAGAPVPPTRVAIAGAARYLLAAQRPGGGFAGQPGGRPSTAQTGWATIALGAAAAGRGPALGTRLQRRAAVALGRAGAALRSRRMRPRSVADLARSALALRATGRRRDLARARPLAFRLARRQRADGSFVADVNVTAHALRALRLRGARGARARLRAARWLLRRQRPDGGFAAGRGRADPDTTGAVLWALPRNLRPAATRRALRWLTRHQGADGGFAATAGDASNAQSTALAVLGLAASGRDPRRLRNAEGRSPLLFLRACARRDGAIAYRPGDARGPVWPTSQALAALVAARRAAR